MAKYDVKNEVGPLHQPPRPISTNENDLNAYGLGIPTQATQDFLSSPNGLTLKSKKMADQNLKRKMTIAEQIRR